MGADHPSVASSLSDLAALYSSQGKYEQAQPLYKRALQIREQKLGPEHPNTAISLNNLASLYQVQEMYTDAQPLYERVLQVYEQQLGANHSGTRNLREHYTDLLRKLEADGTQS